MADASRDKNRIPSILTVSNVDNSTIKVNTGRTLTNAVPQDVAIMDSNGNITNANPLNLAPYDYVSLAINSATETYTFKTGGSGGTTTNTIVIVYTDSSRTDISTVTKT